MPDLKFDNKWYKNGLEVVNAILFGKWKMVILYQLKNKPLRFSEIRKHIPSITDRMLSLQLKELEEIGFIIKETEPGSPPKSVYRLSEIGEKGSSVFEYINDYGIYLSKALSKQNKTSVSLTNPSDEESFFDQL
jgi:DNA-binding HxlR family transcriptional regulator